LSAFRAVFKLSVIRRLFTVRRVLFALLSIPAGLVILLWTSGYWLPWVAPTVVGWAGVEIDEAARAGPGRIELRELRYADAGFTLSIDRVELPTPVAYLRERWSEGGFSERSRLHLTEAELILADSDKPGQAETIAETDAAVGAMLDRVNESLEAADPWLPGIVLDRLEVRGADLAHPLEAEDFQLEEGAFALTVAESDLSPGLWFKGSLIPNEPWTIVGSVPGQDVDGSFRLAPSDAPDDGWTLSGDLRRATDHVALRAQWDASGLQPSSAEVDATGFTLPANWLRAVAADYEYGPLQIEALTLNWKDGRYAGDLTLSGEAAWDGNEAVPLRAELSLSGDLKSLTIEAARVDARWLQCRLDGPLVVRFDERGVDRDARFDLRLDLSAQPFVAASGTAEGSLQVGPASESGFEATFDLSAADLGYDSYSVPRAEVEGGYASGVLRIAKAAIFPADGDDVVRLSGEVDLAARELDLNASLKADQGEWLNALAGQSIFDGEQSVEATIRGSFDQPAITGTLRIGAKVEGLSRLRLDGTASARVATSPFAVPAFAFDGSAKVDRGGIEIATDGRWNPNELQLDIRKLVSKDSERPRLALTEPTALRLDLETPKAPIEQRLDLAPFRLTGPGIELSGSWASGEPLQLRAANLSSKRIDRWLKSPLPAILVEFAELEVVALRPWLEGRLSIEANHADPELGRLHLSGKSRFGDDGVVAETLELSLNDESLLSGSGRAPVRFGPFAGNGAGPVDIDPNGELTGAFSGRSTRAFTAWLKHVTGAVVSDARLTLGLAGSPAAPQGKLSLAAKTLEVPADLIEASIPPLRDFRLEASADADRLNVDPLEFSVNDSPVRGSAAVPIEAILALVPESGERDWRSLAKAARAEVTLENWKLADWAGRVPAALRRSGRLNGYLRLETGLDLTGELTFSNFGLRPTASLPPVDHVEGRLSLKDRVLRFEEAGARVGGNPIRFTGELDASNLAAPTWHFHAQGENLPIVRTTDMIIRSDVDLSASQSGNAQPPLVQGQLNLRSSTLLIEFDPLSPSVRSGPRQSPPFFSIAEEPFADWRFDLEIRGDDFLRVRSPYFRGLLSADFDLKGKFAQPQLIGAVRMGESEIRFPGAKVKVDSGEAYIAEGRSDVVQLDITGVAKTSSYVIGMDVSNTLADPYVTFQSTPELSNAEIVRLLATGSTRSGGAGTVGLYLGQGLLGGPGMDESVMDRLTIDIGQNVTRKGKETVGVEYDLADDYYLHGEYDEYDAYNLDLVWSLFRK